jgi:hypothetical protein
LIKLEDARHVIFLPLDKHPWSIFADDQRVRLGLLLNIALPPIFEAFEAALQE